MKAKTLVVSFAVLLLAGSLALAGDQKPFKGSIHFTSTETISLDQAKNYPYLAEVIGLMGEPDPVSLFFTPPTVMKGEGRNNVGGESTYTNAQLFYLYPLDEYWSRYTMVFYEDCTITVANGDQIYVRIEAVYYSSIDKLIAEETVVGGTGRFEGATGSFEGIWDSNKDIVHNGYIVTNK